MKVTIDRALVLVLALAAGIFAAGCGSQESPSTPSDLVSVAPENAAGAKAATLAAPGCREITGVRLQRLPSNSVRPLAHVRAIYVTSGPSLGCSVAPQWSSRPAGLVSITKDRFVALVKRSGASAETLVLAQAPNGVVGELRVKW